MIGVVDRAPQELLGAGFFLTEVSGRRTGAQMAIQGSERFTLGCALAFDGARERAVDPRPVTLRCRGGVFILIHAGEWSAL